VAVVFYLVESSLPRCLRKKDPPRSQDPLPYNSSLEKVKKDVPTAKREMSYTPKEHKKWCGASEESILSMLRFQRERACIRANRMRSELSKSDTGLESDQETLMGGGGGSR
jgi:hypothetical protein